MIILMAVLTNFHRMNGPDGGREREHEADRGSEANYCSEGVPLLLHLLLLLLHLLLLQVLHSHLLSLHPNTHSANLYCPFLQLLLLQQPLSALRLIPLPQDLLYDYFFCRYRPLPVVANPLNYQHRSRQYFIPGTKNRPASTPDFLLRPLWEARPCPCHHLLYTVSMFERAGMR